MNITKHDVVVLGESIVGSLVAATLAERGVECVLVAQTTAQATEHLLISWLTLASAGFQDLSGFHPIAAITRTRLSEFEAVEAQFRSERFRDLATQLFIVDRQDLVRRLLSGSKVTVERVSETRTVIEDDRVIGVQVARTRRLDARLVVTAEDSAAAPSQVDQTDELQPELFKLICDIGWRTPSDDRNSWNIVDGFLLESNDGFATILKSPLGTFISMAVSMQTTLATGISPPDLLDDLIAHPILSGGLPDRSPDFRASRVAPANPSIGVIEYRPGLIDLSGLSAPNQDLRIDQAVRSSQALASEIATALEEDDLSTSRMSRLNRAVRRSRPTRSPETPLLGQAAERWLLSDSDRIFADLFE